jgi:hypothetical protein
VLAWGFPDSDHEKQESDLDTEPVLLVRSLQHPEMLNTRYLRLSRRGRRRPLASLDVRCLFALLQLPASGISRLRHSVGVWAYRPQVCAITTKR